MANAKRKIVEATLPVTHSRRGEKVVVGYTDSEHILDPNDPRAVEVAADGLGGGNPLETHLRPSPNEVAGDEAAQYVNPHTGENTTDGSATEPSPVPDNVPQAESVDDVTDGQTLTEESDPADVQVDPVVVEVQNPDEPSAPEDSPVEADPPDAEADVAESDVVPSGDEEPQS